MVRALVMRTWHWLAPRIHILANSVIIQRLRAMCTRSPLCRVKLVAHHTHGHLPPSWRCCAGCGGPRGLPGLLDHGTPAACASAKKRLAAAAAMVRLPRSSAAVLGASPNWCFQLVREALMRCSHGRMPSPGSERPSRKLVHCCAQTRSSMSFLGQVLRCAAAGSSSSLDISAKTDTGHPLLEI
eukprot:9484548-Pyramimonas_sp.AAC.1